jgi:shikimate 5-dehydrogenase
MHPQVDRSLLPASWLRPHHVVLDMIYRPRRTLLLQQAQRVGAATIEGGKMFEAQAEEQYLLFTGLPAPEGLMHRVLEAVLHSES